MKKLLYLTVFTILFALPLYSQEYFPMGEGFNDDVQSLVVHNGEIYAGGFFTTSGSTVVNHIARWDGTKWNPLGSGANDYVLALASYKGELYIGGGFTSIGGKPIKGIAKWDGSGYTAIDPTEVFNVLGMMVFEDKLIVGALAGCTYSYDGNEWKNIGCLDGQAMGIYKDELYVSGSSYSSGERQLRKWVDDNDTTIALANEYILDMAVIGDKLYLGGALDSIDGAYVRKLAVYDGVSYTDLGGSMTNGEEIAALESYGDRLIAGGYFFSMGGTTASSLAIYDSGKWYPLGGGVNKEVQDLLRIGGRLYVAGNFKIAAGEPMNHVMYLDIPDSYASIGRLDGMVYFDSAKNCIFDKEDITFANVIIKAEPGPFYGISDGSGKYSISLPPGSYTLRPLPLEYMGQICPPGSSLSAEIKNSGDTVAGLDFAFHNSDSCANIEVSLVSGLPWWVCFKHGVNVSITNRGGNIARNSKVTITLPSIFSIDPSWNSFGLGTVKRVDDTHGIIEIEEIRPGQSSEYSMGFSVTCDDTYHNTYQGIIASLVSDTKICQSAKPPEESYSEIGAPLDPNNILVKAQRFENGAYVTLDTIDDNDELEYCISFQNVGTAPAINVTVYDTLPPQVDIETFRPISTMHPAKISILGTNIIQWKFTNIMLPDSTHDEPHSHGAIIYKIKQKPGNTPGTTILNTASIYFDRNSPVKTNSTMNIIPLPSGVSDPSHKPGIITLTPNPAASFMDITFKDRQLYHLTIIDALGRNVKSFVTDKESFRLVTDDFTNGVYYLVVNTDDIRETQKFVIAR